jgi:hypothetical protein
LQSFHARGAAIPVTLTPNGVEHACRGDRTSIELFIAGVQGWEAGLRRQMDDGKSPQD